MVDTTNVIIIVIDIYYSLPRFNFFPYLLAFI